ncbi:MAG: TRAP transporter substrate-binding protein [Candidatus Eremiobacteraeota bacterium]|nr:TRAP transporter substrate-binding protein [Candidatus Eremiobacteraeota bacterium]
MRRRGFLFGSGAAFASIGVVRGPARAAEFSWKLSHNLPVGSPLHVRAVQCCNAIKRESGGRLEIAIFPFNTLGSDPAVFTQLRSGAVQVYVGSGGLWGTVVPVANIENVGFAFKTAADAFRTFDGPLGAYVRKDAESKGIVVLDRVWDNGMRNVTSSSKPVRTAADLDGFRIRTPAGRMWIDLFKGLGASPTPINANELYTALQTHVVDGQENALFGIDAYRLYEVQKYLSITNHMFAGYWWVVNPDAWKALGPDLQTVVQRNVSKYGLLQRRDTELQNESYADKLHREGMTVNAADVATMRSRLAPLYAKWKADFGPAWTLLEDSVGKLT